MKSILISLLFLGGMTAYSQDSEFKIHDNGLIYSVQAVGKLKHIVDSLNLKFKTCDYDKVFYAQPQARVNYLSIDGKKATTALKDIQAGATWDMIKSKYSADETESSLPLVTFEYEDYSKKKILEFRIPDLGERSDLAITFNESSDFRKFSAPQKGQWVYKYYEKTSYSDESVSAFYFLEPLAKKPIPEQYGRFIQYADCLIDTTSQVYLDKAKESGVRYQQQKNQKADYVLKYIAAKLKRPSMDSPYDPFVVQTDTLAKKLTRKQERDAQMKQEQRWAEYEKYVRTDEYANKLKQYFENLERFEASRLRRTDSLMAANPQLRKMFDEAYDETLKSGVSSDEFEELIGRYVSNEKALELKRSRRVIGGCSMDQSPRIHAFNIALLSAETTKWEIFLRSHLDIMNDRFDRVSDGSYAQAGRSTYIGELETLDINVPELMMGVSLRVSNPSDGHYFANIWRTGRAIAESKDRKIFEETFSQLVADPELDDYNRIIVYYLFRNYQMCIADEALKADALKKLNTAIATLPEHIASRLNTK